MCVSTAITAGQLIEALADLPANATFKITDVNGRAVGYVRDLKVDNNPWGTEVTLTQVAPTDYDEQWGGAKTRRDREAARKARIAANVKPPLHPSPTTELAGTSASEELVKVAA